VDYLPPADEHNPYAAPQSSMKPDRLPAGAYGAGRFTGLNPNATVRLELIGEAWELLKARFGTWALIMIVNSLAGAGIGMAAGLLGMAVKLAIGVPLNPESTGDFIAFFSVAVVQQIVTQCVTAFLMMGLFRTAIKQVRGEPIADSDLFSGGNVWLQGIIAILLTTLATFGGFFLLIIGMFYIGARLSLTLPLVADGQMSAVEAMGMSWRALKGQVLMAFAFGLVVGIVSIVGVFACIIGVIFSQPMLYLCYALLYRDFFLSDTSLPTGSPWIYDKPDVLEEL
jgi:hypothetical protein